MKYENLIVNPDKQVNKVGSTKWETEYNSTASKRIDEMPRNATNPIDIKENQMKKGPNYHLAWAALHAFPCCENEHVFMICISIKLKVRGGGAPFL